YVGRPSDIAQAALFLASDAARLISGHNLVVDGGISAGWPIAVARDDIALFGETFRARRTSSPEGSGGGSRPSRSCNLVDATPWPICVYARVNRNGRAR